MEITPNENAVLKHLYLLPRFSQSITQLHLSTQMQISSLRRAIETLEEKSLVICKKDMKKRGKPVTVALTPEARNVLHAFEAIA